jgi:hypothetical protein
MNKLANLGTMLMWSENLVHAEFEQHSDEGLCWYRSLTLNQRINLKDCFRLLTGIDFQSIGFMFTLRERINILYGKLKFEGIIK